MASRLSPGTAMQASATWAVHAIGARVWLPRAGRHGRVIARAHGGLIYRVRLEGGRVPPLFECPACELQPADADGAG